MPEVDTQTPAPASGISVGSPSGDSVIDGLVLE